MTESTKSQEFIDAEKDFMDRCVKHQDLFSQILKVLCQTGNDGAVSLFYLVESIRVIVKQAPNPSRTINQLILAPLIELSQELEKKEQEKK